MVSVDENGNVVTDAKILFTVCNGEEIVVNGTIYISGTQPALEYQSEEIKEYQPGVYTAKLVGTGMHLSQNEEQSGAAITLAGARSGEE